MKTFSEKVVEKALQIPSGRVTTYGRIARAASGGAMSAQSVTNILWRAQLCGIKNIPYHRIVYADGKIWVNAKYRRKRLALYKKENIEIDTRDRIKNFNKLLFEYK
jgi:alkylated DNA nucleotide flippase Atl1